jgi:hypothetical protein
MVAPHLLPWPRRQKSSVIPQGRPSFELPSWPRSAVVILHYWRVFKYIVRTYIQYNTAQDSTIHYITLHSLHYITLHYTRLD